MNSITYNKLVRDRIPEIIENNGNHAVIETLDREAYKKSLDIKLGEELQEYLASDSVDELADLVEVVYAILKYKGTELAEFDRIRLKKAEDRGGFDKRLFLKSVSSDK